MKPGPLLEVWDRPFSLLGARSDVLSGYVVVSRHYGLTRKSAHNKAVLAMARMLAKDLTARRRT